jgi:uncharacterized membrane protein YccF (DUF307 family)
MDVLRFLLNVAWLILCGFWMAVGYAIAGIICCVLIITIPFRTVRQRSASRSSVVPLPVFGLAA